MHDKFVTHFRVLQGHLSINLGLQVEFFMFLPTQKKIINIFDRGIQW